MRRPLLFAALLGASAIAAPLPAAAAQQAERDWSRTVAVTAEGGYRMGNPDAPVKLVEFVSLTCGHCAHFSAEGVPPLVEKHVRTGRVSFELRNFVLNGIDLVAALVSRCAAPDDYFALSSEILKEQEAWVARTRSLTPAQREQIGALSPTEGMRRLAGEIGLGAIAGRHGIEQSELRTCLSDPARVERLETMQREAERLGVSGTPTFAINGKVAQGVYDWASLEPLLRRAGRQGD